MKIDELSCICDVTSASEKSLLWLHYDWEDDSLILSKEAPSETNQQLRIISWPVEGSALGDNPSEFVKKAASVIDGTIDSLRLVQTCIDEITNKMHAKDTSNMAKS